MGRHSKNNTALGFFTSAERAKLTYGTQRERLGRDSQRDVDECTLCLQRAVNAVCCKRGHLFCRECVVKSMLQQKQDGKKAECFGGARAHLLRMKELVSVRFSTAGGRIVDKSSGAVVDSNRMSNALANAANSSEAICCGCARGLTNASGASVFVACGHVGCRVCVGNGQTGATEGMDDKNIDTDEPPTISKTDLSSITTDDPSSITNPDSITNSPITTNSCPKCARPSQTIRVFCEGTGFSARGFSESAVATPAFQ